MASRSSRALCRIERLLVLIAALAFAIVCVDLIRAEGDAAAARRALAKTSPQARGRPDVADADTFTGRSTPVTTLPAGDEPIQPVSRVAEASLEPTLVGELQIPHVDLSTMVFDVRDAASLRHAAGHVRGTSLPWQRGNSAVAGHRDSAFRRLRDVRPGDDIRFVTPHGTFDYRVTRAFVVYPHEVWVLNENAAALTLITCFPFRWVGTAPERWVIHATRRNP